MSKKVTLYQALKQSGLFASKEELTNAVNKGRVTVDGIVTKTLQFQFSPIKRKIFVDNNPISLTEKRYFVLNKPQAYSCQKNDNYPYVVQLLDIPQEIKNTLFVIGRLDIPTTGLLLITNDGAFGERLTNPKSNIPKTYKILLKEKVTQGQCDALKNGVVIDVQGKDYKTAPATVQPIDERTILLTITEGKYRQVRKMAEAVGNTVAALMRIQIGNLNLPKNLHEGQWREYSEEEMKDMFSGFF